MVETWKPFRRARAASAKRPYLHFARFVGGAPIELNAIMIFGVINSNLINLFWKFKIGLKRE